MGDYFPPWLDQLVTDAREVLADWDETVARRLSERIDEVVSAPQLQGDPPRVSRGLILVSSVKKRQGDLPGYVRTLRRAIGVADTEEGEDRDYVRTVAGTALVGVLEDLGERTEADGLRSTTLQSARRLTGRNRRLLCVCLGTFGLGYSSQGDLARSELLFAEAVDVAREEPVDRSTLAATIDALAAHYDSTGAAGRAERLRLEALSLHRQSGVSERLVDSLITLAEMRWYADDRVGAESLLEEADVAARQLMEDGDRGLRPPLLRRLVHARRTVRADDDEQYAANLQQALDLSRASVGSPSTAASLTRDLAELRLAQGRLGEADSLGAELLATQRATGPASQEFRGALILCARVKRLRGQASAAESLAREALIADDSRVHRPRALRELALSLTGLGRYGESLAALQEAAVLDDRRAGQVFTSRSQVELLQYVRVLRMTTGQLISLALDFEPAAEGAFQALLRRKSLGAFAALTRRQAVLSHSDPHLQDAYARLTTTNLDIARHELIPQRRGGVDGSGLASRLVALRERASQLEAEIATRIPEADVLIDALGGSQEIAATLRSDEALVEFARFGHVMLTELRPRTQRYVAFIVRGGETSPMTMLDLGPTADIDEAVKAFRARLLSQPTADHDRSEGQSAGLIGQLLIEPLLSTLGDVRHLLIAPDSQLARLPFAALPIGGNAHLVDRYSVVYVSTGRDLLRRPRGSPPLPTLPLVVADPDFDATPAVAEDAAIADKDETRHRQDPALTRALGRFPRLPGTAEEGSVVADLLHVPAVTGRQASKALVLGARSPQVLHIATHGFSLEKDSDESAVPAVWSFVEDFAHRGSLENPLLRCGLAMAGANTYLARRERGAALDDGIVNGEDISSLDLRGTELVVLSACETGLGKIQAGEGVLGLVRAFLLAGARSVLATLWPIPDLATRVLVEHFYRARALSSTSAEALAIAQLATRSTHPEPVNWAGFVCFEAYRGHPPTQLSGPSDRS